MLYAPDALSMDRYVQSAQQTAAAMGIRLTPLPCQSEADLGVAFGQSLARDRGALFISSTGVSFVRRTHVIEFAALHRFPAIYVSKELVAEGGLISYGVKPRAAMVRAATIIDRILKGAKPADIPVEQPTRFELVINLKTAKALGITIPQSLLLRADEVIQ